MKYRRQRNPLAPLIGALLIFATQIASAQQLSAGFYEVGSPTLTEYYVDPQSGSDNNNGLTRESPRKSVTSIWNALPENQALSSGIRINLLPGTYGSSHLPNYWENRTGTHERPIVIRAVDGFGTVTLNRDINMAGVSYFYLQGVTIVNQTTGGYGDAFHCERCDHILLRGNSFNGAPNGRNAGGDIAHETVKFNQSQYIYIENNNIQGADDNGIDWVSVQYGHIRANRIHDTSGWCMYAKGGSSYILVEGNIAYECGEGGITVGQGTGFEFMTSPWIRFEANYIKVVNNVIHDIEGAALGVNGGYGVLLAHNTAYRTGSRSHLLEIVFGERSCDGDIAACTARRTLGGWGPVSAGSDQSQPIGNRDVIVANNIFYNPAGFVSGSQHMAIYGPRTPSASGIPSPQVTDSGLKIQGNIFWNGNTSMPLGIEDSEQGCQTGNPDCNQAQLQADNRFNSTEPDFISASGSDFRPQASGVLAAISAPAIADLPAIDSALNPIDEGVRSNLMSREFSGASAATRPPGAFVSATSSVTLPSSPESDGTTPDPGSQNAPPTLSISKASAKRDKKKITVTVQANASDSDGVEEVSATVIAGKKELGELALTLSGRRYAAKGKFKSTATKIKVRVSARDSLGVSTTKNKSITVE